MIFETTFVTLSKLAEQPKLRIFKIFFLFRFFVALQLLAAPPTWHTKNMCYLNTSLPCGLA
jgi:hypothetical protein